MGLIQLIINVIVILLVAAIIIMAPVESFNFVVKVGSAAIKTIGVAYQEGKPVIVKVMSKMSKEETNKTENLNRNI